MVTTEELLAFEAMVSPRASDAFPDGVNAESPTFGDPVTSAVLTTRVLPRGKEQSVNLRLRVWPTTGAPGTAGSQTVDVEATATHGFVAQLPVAGLDPDADYRYQFERVADGKISAIGRMNTLELRGAGRGDVAVATTSRQFALAR